MGVVTMSIVEPSNGQNFVGTSAVRLRGAVGSSGHGTLFFKWYSNLAETPAAAALNFDAALPIGSQVLILSAKDVAGETVAELQSVQHAGMAGGPPSVAAPCLIHVLVANLLEPFTPGSVLSKANSLLTAQAPPQWGDAEYQSSVNRLRYRWRFTPAGSPPGRRSADFTPDVIFDPPGRAPNDAPGAVPRVRFQGALPAEVDSGSYLLTLRLERTDAPEVGHEVTRNVVLTA